MAETNLTFRWRRPLAMAAFALAGALIAERIVETDPVPGGSGPLFSAGMVAFYVAGGAVAGLLCASLFGRPGIGGVLLALLGGVLATLLTGILGAAATALPTAIGAGSFVQGLIGVGFGALSYPMAAAGAPDAALIWFAIVAATHVAARLLARPARA